MSKAWLARLCPAGVALLVALGGPTWAGAQETATFELVVDYTWTTETAPFEFPSGAHFSRLVGATHHSRYVMFRDGHTASSGIELMAENGRGSVLVSELQESMRRGRVGTVFEGPGVSPPPGQVSVQFETTKEHFFVSFTSMVAPSPDWFTGAADVRLVVDDEWIDGVDLVLWAWDAGTDNGTTYRPEPRNADAQPQQSVRLVATPHFLSADGLVPVGTARLRRVNP